MAGIKQFEIFAVDLPFRKAFEHAAAKRSSSSSIFLKCVLESGTVGYGECLPREYVTGESRDHVYDLLRQQVLPRLIHKEFSSLDEVKSFLRQCDGKAPEGWGLSDIPQTAAWCAIDLALLDSCSREFETSLFPPDYETQIKKACYSAVISSGKSISSLLKTRLYGIKQVKLKVEKSTTIEDVKKIRRILGNNCDIRVDANMSWTKEEALLAMKDMSALGISSFEQPLAANKTGQMAELVKESNQGIMADESLNDADSLAQLIDQGACTAINVRISKCGGLMASLARCQEAQKAGLTIQIGCQVGESSLLSAAHLNLVSQVPSVRYLEGCFGLLLLKKDPVSPLLQFGYGGKISKLPQGYGLGVTVDEETLRRWTGKSETIT